MARDPKPDSWPIPAYVRPFLALAGLAMVATVACFWVKLIGLGVAALIVVLVSLGVVLAGFDESARAQRAGRH